MHAFLIIGNKTAVNKKIEEKIKDLKAKAIEFPLKKVADLQELNSFTKLQLTEETTIVIKDFDEANEETQNSFLKSLEEPQKRLSFILTGGDINNILPTILSRCELIELSDSNLAVSEEVKSRFDEFISADAGKKLSIVSKINKREDAVLFIRNLILAGHNTLMQNPQSISFLESANQTLGYLEANGNVQLQLTNFIVNISI